uniref:Uncharacterized protein n=1 Tax=Panagrolaimus sp. JU765 TaxID=591449 RepID=A0AC34RMW8_9BILA
MDLKKEVEQLRDNLYRHTTFVAAACLEIKMKLNCLRKLAKVEEVKRKKVTWEEVCRKDAEEYDKTRDPVELAVAKENNRCRKMLRQCCLLNVKMAEAVVAEDVVKVMEHTLSELEEMRPDAYVNALKESVKRKISEYQRRMQPDLLHIHELNCLVDAINKKFYMNVPKLEEFKEEIDWGVFKPGYYLLPPCNYTFYDEDGDLE